MVLKSAFESTVGTDINWFAVATTTVIKLFSKWRNVTWDFYKDNLRLQGKPCKSYAHQSGGSRQRMMLNAKAIAAI